MTFVYFQSFAVVVDLPQSESKEKSDMTCIISRLLKSLSSNANRQKESSCYNDHSTVIHNNCNDPRMKNLQEE